MSDNFYLKRRSVLAKKMRNHPIKDDDLLTIINAGIRVPDHGALNPWKIKVIKDDKLKVIDENIILTEFKRENPEIWTPKLKKEIYDACRTIVEHEDAFIDLAFEMGPMKGLTAQEVKDYIRFIGNRRLVQLGLEPIYDVEKNPLTWLDTMLNAVEHMNFFEGRATEYSKASTQGTWVEAFS